MSVKKKTIWALFDSEAECCLNSLSGDKAGVYSFGVGTGKNHIHLDLSDFETAREELLKYPSPDYIFASPPCESWVVASACNKSRYTSEPGINLCWQSRWRPFDFTAGLKAKRQNGVCTALTAAKIIQYFKPVFWAIENGNRSLIFDFLSEFGNLTGYRNKCTYFSYGFPVIKRTLVYSNALLNLKAFLPAFKCQFRNIEFLSGSKERSLVPAALYRDIFSQFLLGGQKELFPNGSNHNV